MSSRYDQPRNPQSQKYEKSSQKYGLMKGTSQKYETMYEERTPLLPITDASHHPNPSTVTVSVNDNDINVNYLQVSQEYLPAFPHSSHVLIPPPDTIPPKQQAGMTEARLKWMKYTILLTVLIQSVGFTLVLPSMYEYLLKLKGDTSFYGWVVAMYPRFGSIAFGWWYDKRRPIEPISVAIVIGCVGNLFYSFLELLMADHAYWLMFVSRFLVGFGSGCVAVCRAYCSEVTELKEKVAVMAAVSAAQGIGFVIGPGFGSVLSLVDFRIGNVSVNACTSPGFLSVVLAAVNIALVIVFLRDTQKRSSHAKVDKSGDEDMASVGVALFLFFVAVSVFAIFETDLTILAKNDFGWGAMKNSIYFLVAAIISTIAYILIATPRFKSFDERPATVLGFIVLIIGMLAFMIYNKPFHLENKLHIAQLFIGGFFFSIGYPVSSTYIFGLYSKILNPRVQGSKMGWITAVGSLARMLGPIWASYALAYSDSLLFGGTAIFLCIACVVLVVFRSYLVPHRDYGKPIIIKY